MNTRMKNQKNMYDQVRTVLVNHQPMWENLPAFADSAEHFFQLLDELNLLKNAQDKKITHLTKHKNLLMKDCLDQGHYLIEVLKLHAIKTDNTLDILKYSISKNEFIKGRTKDKLERLQDVVVDLQPVKVQLAVYGVNEAEINAYEAKVINLAEIVSIPREKIVSRHTVTELLEQTNEAISNLLNLELDVMIKPFRTSEPEFAIMYSNARVIVDAKPHGKPKTSDDSPERDDGGF